MRSNRVADRGCSRTSSTGWTPSSVWGWALCTGLRLCRFCFFSSRRRHTRFDCDWSSDVCSSDLVVKIGTITETGEEVIFDIRKAGEVVGELSASSSPRIDRAVALELTQAVPVSYEEILATIQKNQPLLRDLIQLFCDSLLNAQEQVTSLAFRDTMQRLTKTLLDLAGQLGRPAGKRIEITAYLTQEELAQMVAARRESVSLGLGLLRRDGLVEYTAHGHLVVDPVVLRDY